ncbi:MAG: phosphoribosylformylglycinamidine synthase subunit PurL [Acidobacteriota bacterium]
MKPTPEEIKSHGLTREEYARIVELLGRDPNRTELGMFSLMWSEHCSYKSSRAHLAKLPCRGERVLQGPGENAGAIDVGDGLAIVFKMESHNHPSFIEPYQGAATGVGGILRDIFTMGARPIAVMDSLRFGRPEAARMSHLVRGVVAGIGGYGNCIGIPTLGGEVAFDPCYDGNILVNAFALGVVAKDRIFRARASGAGNPVIYVGSSTGRDGIHGATMASASFGGGGEERRPTVQVGDPFTEKLLLEACLELARTPYVVAIQDMGAAGLTSSSAEMAARGGAGIDLDLARVPRREQGMTPYEVMLSESQERMLLVVQKGTEDRVFDIFRKWDLQVAVIGHVTDDGLLTVRDSGEVVARVPARALTEEAPRYRRPVEEPGEDHPGRRAISSAEISEPEDLGRALERLLSSPNLCSRAWVYEQYDYSVRTNTVIPPGGGAALLRLKGTGRGIALSVDCNSRWCYLDPKLGAAHAVAEAARNLSCVGAEPVGLTDCLNFGNPEHPRTMWQFERAVEGMAEACEKLGVPVVSGNVSFYNETSGRDIHPTPVIAMVGLLEDISAHAGSAFLEDGDVIALVGKTLDELGGSEYLAVLHGREQGAPPALDLGRERAVQRCVREAVRRFRVRSAHDCSSGGLAVALAECCLTGPRPRGAEVDLGDEHRADVALFSETASRVLVSGSERSIEELERLCEASGVRVRRLGAVGGRCLKIRHRRRLRVELDIGSLKEAWSTAFGRLVEDPALVAGKELV